MGLEKEYTGTLILGQTRPSIDKETEVDSEKEISHLTHDQIYEAATKLQGVIEQIPPQHSAIKVNGKRVYKSARAGVEVKLQARTVEVPLFEISRIELPEVDFRVICSKGTYIRSLVRDLGEALGVGAYLSGLRRIRIGNFTVNDAEQPPEFLNRIKQIQPNDSI